MQYWINTKKGDDTVLAITEDVFYISNPNETQLQDYKFQLQQGKIPPTLTGVTFANMRAIEFEEGTERIMLYYGEKDGERLKVSNPATRTAIKEALKAENTPYINQELIEPSFWRRSKPFLIGTLAISFFTAYIYDTANNMEQGAIYEARGGTGNLVIGAAQTSGSNGALLIGGILLFLLIVLWGYKLRKKIVYDQFLY